MDLNYVSIMHPRTGRRKRIGCVKTTPRGVYIPLMMTVKDRYDPIPGTIASLELLPAARVLAMQWLDAEVRSGAMSASEQRACLAEVVTSVRWGKPRPRVKA